MKRLPYVLLSIAVILFDIITKNMIIKRFKVPGLDVVTVIPDFFQIVHVRNTGAAFGLGANSASPLVPLLLSFGAVAVFIMVVIYSVRSALTDRLLQTGLHLILGGAVGNLIDRFRYGSVVDFLDFYIRVGGKSHHWPAFNVADSAICVGIGLLFLDMWRNPNRDAQQASPVQEQVP